MAGIAIRSIVETSGDVIVDGVGGNGQRCDHARNGHRGQQPEHHDGTAEIGRCARNRGGGGIPRMIERLVAADAFGESFRSDDPQRDRRDGGRKDRPGAA